MITDQVVTWQKAVRGCSGSTCSGFSAIPEGPRYIAILPGWAFAGGPFSRQAVFGYRAMVGAISAIGFLGFCVSGHHMFVSGIARIRDSRSRS